MTTGKVIAVAGATGKQGYSVVEALLFGGPSANEYEKIRCLTRNTKSEKAQTLAALSPKIQLVECNMCDVESLKEAFKDAWAVFAVTDYWDPETYDKEYEFGKNMANAAKDCQVMYYIWSTLDNAEKITRSKYKVKHFTLKARVMEYIRGELGDSLKSIFIKPGTYYTNFQTYFPPKKTGEPNQYTLALPVKPSTRVPFFDPADTGPIVAAILSKPDHYIGKEIPLYGDLLTYPEALKEIGQATGKNIRYECVPYEACQALGQDMLDMFHYFDEFGYFPKETNPDMTLAKEIYPKIKDIHQWVKSTQFEF
jgi:uncharacterized protein YbjT (DUF2867 family)